MMAGRVQTLTVFENTYVVGAGRSLCCVHKSEDLSTMLTRSNFFTMSAAGCSPCVEGFEFASINCVLLRLCSRECVEDRNPYGLGSPSPVLPDPPGAGGVKDERSDEEIESTWARAMVTAHSSNMDEAIEALKILCYELMEASTPGRASEAILQLLRTSADELVTELVLKLDQVGLLEASVQYGIRYNCTS